MEPPRAAAQASSEPGRTTPQAWAVLALTGLVMILFYLDRQVLSVLKGTLAVKLQLTNSDYSMLVTAFLAPYTAAYLVSGRIVDRWGPRAVGSLCIGFMSVAEILQAMAHTKWELAASRVCLGLAESGVIPFVSVAIMHCFPSERRAFAWAVRGQMQALGPVLATPVVVGLTLNWGWRSAFAVPGVFGCAVAVVWSLAYSRLQGGAAPKAAPEWVPYRELLRNRALWGIMAVRGLTDPVWFFLIYWQPAFLQDKLHLSLAGLGRVAWIPPAVDAVVKIAISLLADRLVRSGAAVGARIRALGLVACLAPAAAILPLARTVPTAILLLSVVYSLCDSWLLLTTVLITDTMPRQTVAATIGIISFLGGVTSIGLNAFAGAMVDHIGYAPVFIYAAVAYPASAYFMRRYYIRPA